MLPVPRPVAEAEEETVAAVGVGTRMVRERMGMLSRFVRRREAEKACWADFRARWKGPSGTSRLIVLFGWADWIV